MALTASKEKSRVINLRGVCVTVSSIDVGRYMRCTSLSRRIRMSCRVIMFEQDQCQTRKTGSVPKPTKWSRVLQVAYRRPKKVRHETRLYIEHVPMYAVAHADYIPFQSLRPLPDSYSISMTSWKQILHLKQYYILSSLYLHPLFLHPLRSAVTRLCHRQPRHTRATCRSAQAAQIPRPSQTDTHTCSAPMLGSPNPTWR